MIKLYGWHPNFLHEKPLTCVEFSGSIFTDLSLWLQFLSQLPCHGRLLQRLYQGVQGSVAEREVRKTLPISQGSLVPSLSIPRTMAQERQVSANTLMPRRNWATEYVNDSRSPTGKQHSSWTEAVISLRRWASCHMWLSWSLGCHPFHESEWCRVLQGWWWQQQWRFSPGLVRCLCGK